MKKVLLILFSLGLLILSPLAQTGWNIYPVLTNDYLRGIQFTDLQTGYINSTDKILKTTNQGSNWVLLNTPLTNIYSFYFFNNNEGIIAGMNNWIGKIFKTTNGGFNWNEVFTIPDSTQKYHYSYIISTSFPTPHIGYASGVNTYAYYILKTTNGGNNWVTINNSANQGGLFFVFTSESTCFALSSAASIIKSTNSGFNWTVVLAGLTNSLNDLQFLNNGLGFVSGSGSIILKTVNGGDNWSTMQLIPYSGTINKIFFVNENLGYSASDSCNYYQSRIHKTTNSGVNWYRQTINSRKCIKDIFFINDNIGFAVGDSGLIIRTTDGGGPIGITPISSEVPQHYTLEQNYPNPFNPNTTIRFSIPTSSDIKITVYDLNGRMIEEIANQFLTAGIYETNWDGDKYASGIYYYRLISDNFTETKKMVLVK